MKTSRITLLLGLAFAAITSLAQAQIYLHSQTVTGNYGSGVTTRFNFAIDLPNNKLTVTVDNTVAIVNGNGTKGTVVSFGFNTPFTGLTTSNVTTTTKWIDWNSGRSSYANQKTINGSSSSFWEEHSPYVINHATQFNQEFGVSTKDYNNNNQAAPDAAGLDSINQGIKYGEVAVFEFTFTNKDIDQSNYKNFFGDNFLSVYWREVTEVETTGQWKWVNGRKTWVTKTTECEVNGGWDKGHGDFWPPTDGDLPPTPEPSTYGLMGAAALLGLVAHRRHKAKKASKTV